MTFMEEAVTVCKLTRVGLKEADRDLKTDSFKRQTLAPVSFRALILQQATEIRTEVGVGESEVMFDNGEACEKRTESLFTSCLVGVFNYVMWILVICIAV